MIINNNLTEGNFNKFIFDVRNKRFSIKIDLDNYRIQEMYTIIYSYILNINIIIDKIFLVTKTENGIFYKNVNFMLDFSYIEFFIWIKQSDGKYNGKVNDTKLIYFEEENTYFLEIYTISDNKYFYKIPSNMSLI